MSAWDTVLGLAAALAVNEVSDVSPWAARRIVRWSARVRYADYERAAIRAEELEALIEGRPGQLLKLITALCFAAATAWARAGRPATTALRSGEAWATQGGALALTRTLTITATAAMTVAVTVTATLALESQPFGGPDPPTVVRAPYLIIQAPDLGLLAPASEHRTERGRPAPPHPLEPPPRHGIASDRPTRPRVHPATP